MKARKIANCELIFIDIQSIINPFIIQSFVEIQEEIDTAVLNNCLNETIKLCEGSDVYKCGKYWNFQFRTRKIELVILENYDNFINNELLNKTINYNKESIQVYYIKFKNYDKKFLLFRFFHGVFDGKGSLMFIDNFLKVLNNIVPEKYKNDVNIDTYIDKKLFYKKYEKNILKFSINEINKINDYNIEWKLINVNKYIHNIIAEIAHIVALQYNKDNVKFVIPVDLRYRYHKDDKNHLGNLILPIYINVGKDEKISSITDKIHNALDNSKELNYCNVSNYGYRHIPTFIRKLFLRCFFASIKNKNIFSAGAIISHLGKINYNEYKKGNIQDLIILPSHNPLTPFSINIVEFKGKTNVIIGYYKGQIPDSILNNIESYLTTL
jgi:hypothetical protein